MPATASETSYIDPDCLYTHNGLITVSGISRERQRRAARDGVTCEKLQVGRRCFYRGRAIIAYIEALAALESRLAAETVGAGN